MQHEEGTFKGVDDVALVWQSWTPDDAPRAVVAIVHGFGEHCARYNYLIDKLAPRGFVVYGFDQRGYGRSAGKRGSIESWDEYRQDVATFLALVREQRPGLPLFLFGHSLGGLIAAHYVLNDQSGLDGVVLSAPMLTPPKVAPALRTVAKVLSRVTPQMSIDIGLDAAGISREPAEVRRYVDDPLVHSKGTPRLSTESDKTIAWTQENAGRLTIPLLIIHGDADPIVPIAGSQQFYRHAGSEDKVFKIYPGGYHESINDIHRAEVLADIHAWLERHVD